MKTSLILLLFLTACAAPLTPSLPIPGATLTPFLPGTLTPSATPTPPPTLTLTPTATPSQTPTPVYFLTGAGDIVYCSNIVSAEDVANLLQNIPGDLFTAGDNSNDAGAFQQYLDCFAPTWGRFLDRIHPAPGNHDYLEPGAAGYFSYFGSAAGLPGEGYYSYDLGEWHIIALNSVCWEIGGCAAGSPEDVWLKADLASHPSRCTLAYWHHPLFSSGSHGANAFVYDLWLDLYQTGVEVVVNGHDHHYERFALQNPDGILDPENGIRQFIAGTGGAGWRIPPGAPVQNSEIIVSGEYGVLKFTLLPGSYQWEFINPQGSVLDSGSDVCH